MARKPWSRLPWRDTSRGRFGVPKTPSMRPIQVLAMLALLLDARSAHASPAVIRGRIQVPVAAVGNVRAGSAPARVSDAVVFVEGSALRGIRLPRLRLAHV